MATEGEVPAAVDGPRYTAGRLCHPGNPNRGRTSPLASDNTTVGLWASCLKMWVGLLCTTAGWDKLLRQPARGIVSTMTAGRDPAHWTGRSNRGTVTVWSVMTNRSEGWVL